jgi:hypothetical protein
LISLADNNIIDVEFELFNVYLNVHDNLHAKDILLNNGRAWIEIYGIQKCESMLRNIQIAKEDAELSYLEGLLYLFDGRYDIAYNHFNSLHQEILVESKIFKTCIELEIAESKRRTGDFKFMLKAINKYKDSSFEGTEADCYWRGVCYELMGHFYRQFALDSQAYSSYTNALNIFSTQNNSSNVIEQFHCHYCRNMIGNNSVVEPYESSGLLSKSKFLRGLYAMSNAKALAEWGDFDRAFIEIKSSITEFKQFGSMNYYFRACVVEFLLIIAIKDFDAVQQYLKTLPEENKIALRKDKIFDFWVSIGNEPELAKSLLAKQFSCGKISKAISMLAIMNKFKKDSEIETCYSSLTIQHDNCNGSYLIKQENVNYKANLEENDLRNLILSYT